MIRNLKSKSSKILSVLLTTALILTVLPGIAPKAAAADTGSQTTLDITQGSIVLGDGTVSGYDSSGNPVTTPNPNGYWITSPRDPNVHGGPGQGVATTNTITVTGGTQKITCEHICIGLSGDLSSSTAFSIAAGATVHLILAKGYSIFDSTDTSAGINVPEGAVLTVDKIAGGSNHDDVLQAGGGCTSSVADPERACGQGAGIGGNGGRFDSATATGEDGQSCGTVVINGGRIVADGGDMTNTRYGGTGAGIGGGGGAYGGNGGDGGNVIITGGQIHAIGGFLARQDSGTGAGIGGGGSGADGNGGDGGSVTINGGGAKGENGGSFENTVPGLLLTRIEGGNTDSGSGSGSGAGIGGGGAGYNPEHLVNRGTGGIGGDSGTINIRNASTQVYRGIPSSIYGGETGNYGGAGIGGGGGPVRGGGAEGGVTVSGSMLMAVSSSGGAGIGSGGGPVRGGGTVSITGSNVYGLGLNSGEIGGGTCGVTISGGLVCQLLNGGSGRLKSVSVGGGSVAIPGGSVYADSIPGATDGGGSPVYLDTVTVKDSAGAALGLRSVTYSVDSGTEIPTQTDDSGNLYLWLTEGNHTISVDGGTGSASGSVTTDDASTLTVQLSSALHSVTIGSMTSGAVTTDLWSAVAGQTVTLTVSPDTGYQLKEDSLQVNGSTAGVIENPDGTFSFTMPDGDATISAQFEEKLTIFPPALAGGTVGSSYNQPLEAGSGASVTWGIAAGSLPDGLTLSSEGIISGTPAGSGTSRFTVRAEDGLGNTDTADLSIRVVSPPTDKVLQSITAPSAVTGVENGTAKTARALGLPDTVTLVTDGGDVGADVTWNLGSGAYNIYNTAEQTFTLIGSVTLPHGVIDPNHVPLLATVPVTVSAASPYGIGLSQSDSYTFPAQTVDYSSVSPLSVTVSNTGIQETGDLTVALSGENSGSFTLSKESISSIATGGSDSFTVVPNTGLSAGAYTATVTVSGGSVVSRSFAVSFTVSEQQTYSISLGQTGSYSFAAQTVGYSPVSPLSVTVSNTGTQATGALAVALSGTNAGSFTLSMESISSIAAGSHDSFTIVPNRGLIAGIYTATVTVSGGNSITESFAVSFTVNSSGGSTYSISLSQNSAYTFPAQTVDYSSITPLSVTVSNTGNQATGDLTMALSGANSGSFTLSKAAIGSIAASGSDSFTVGANTGLSAGTYTATVTVSGGNSITESFAVSFTVNSSGGSTYSIGLSQTDTYTFPAQIVGYSSVSPLSVTVHNTGNQATGDLTVALSGSNANSFTLSKAAIGSIAAGGTDSFTVMPNTGLSAGAAYTATVTVSGGNVASKSFDVSFTVGEQQTYGIGLSQSSAYTFPAQTVDYSSITPLSVTVSNTGNQATGDLTVALSGSNAGSFTLSKATISSIAASGSDSFTVMPNTGLSAGTYTATVTVSGGNSITESFAVSFTVNSSGGSTGGGSSDGGGVGSMSYQATATASNGTSKKISVTTSRHNASVAIGTSESYLITDGNTLKIDMPNVPSASSYGVKISASALSENAGGTLTMSTALGDLSMPANMLSSLSDTANKTARVAISAGDTSVLSGDVQASIGDRPVVQLTLTLGGTQTEWSNPDVPVTVSIPYTPTESELKNPDSIVVWYIDGSENAVCIPNGHYDSATGTVTFAATHFSQYAVVYRDVSFSDVSGWYENAVNYLAARGITGGTGGGKFSPEAVLTRAQFVTILARLSGNDLSGYTASSFTDVSTDDWCFAAAQWAYKNGVAEGCGGKFSPDASITRQDIAVMLVRYAEKVAGYTLPETNDTVTFTDNSEISSYASGAVNAMQRAGIIAGCKDGSFDPLGSTTRAEAAKMIALLQQKIVK